MQNTITHDDCLNWFKQIQDGTIDCVVTDLKNNRFFI
jgi:hypothetical protein